MIVINCKNYFSNRKNLSKKEKIKFANQPLLWKNVSNKIYKIIKNKF